MNWNFMMAGSASVNPVFLMLSIFLILAWRTAGWWGVDRWILNQYGTPWQKKKTSKKAISNRPDLAEEPAMTLTSVKNKKKIYHFSEK